jgi:hypothetical protein
VIRVLALLLLLLPATAHAGGRWYAWVDRVPAGAAAAAVARFGASVGPVQAIRSERFQGVEDGYAYIIAGEYLFESEARARVRALGRAAPRAGVQYFSDRRDVAIERAADAREAEPLFAVETEIDGGPPAEILVLTRTGRGGLLHVVRRHGDGALSRLVNFPVPLYGLPGSTQGERVRVHPLRAGDPAGKVLVFEAGFDTGGLQGVWTLLFVVPDLKDAPRVFVVPGAVSPVATRFAVTPDADGVFGYTLTLEGEKPFARRMAWTGETFAEAK